MSKRLRPAQYKSIEDEIRYYHDTKKELEQLRVNVVLGSTFQEYSDENTGGGSAGQINNPTEQRALLLQMDKQIERRQRVILALESVLNKLSDEDKQLIHFRYWDRSKPTWIWIANKLNMSESTAKRKRRDIIYKIAERLGY
jgi:RinA family phage transcriptional activator